MKAKILNHQAPGGKRTKLSRVVPLSTPYVVQIFPIYACNFKCNYCIFQIEKEERHFISNKVIMDLNLYKKCVDDMTHFPNKIKTLRFVGIGEPLLHKNIIEMIQYTKEKDIANTVELITNASLLTNNMSDKLIDLGLDRLVISLQGLTKEKYKQVCQYDIDMQEFINNIKYFYNNKKNTHLYIKIVDIALDLGEEKKFYNLFENICDSISIEHTVPIHTGIEVKEKEEGFTQFGLPIKDIDICPQPFIHLQINPDGVVVPCYSFDYPEILGNVNIENVVDIWNGEKFDVFRLYMLDDFKCSTCKECTIAKYRWFEEDNLESVKNKLKDYYEQRILSNM